MDNWGKTNVIAATVSACVAVFLLCLALWGFFFTSAPEKLLESLNSEVSLAKQELEIAIREKDRINVSIELLKKENDSLLEKNEKIIRKYEDSTASLAKIKTRLEAVELKEIERTSLYKKNSIKKFVSSANSRLSSYDRNALIISEYKLSNDFIKSQPSKDEPNSWEKHKEWFMKLPNFHIDSFKDTSFGDIAIASGNTDVEYNQKRIIPSLQADKLIIAFDQSKTQKTGTMFFNELLSHYKKMEPDVQIYSEIKALVYSKMAGRNSLDSPIEPLLYRSFSEEQIVEQGNESLKTIAIIKIILNDIALQNA